MRGPVAIGITSTCVLHTTDARVGHLKHRTYRFSGAKKDVRGRLFCVFGGAGDFNPVRHLSIASLFRTKPAILRPSRSPFWPMPAFTG